MKNTLQALKYPSADAVALYIQVSRQLIENKNDLLKLTKPKRTILIDSQTPKTYIYTRFRENSEKKLKKN